MKITNIVKEVKPFQTGSIRFCCIETLNLIALFASNRSFTMFNGYIKNEKLLLFENFNNEEAYKLFISLSFGQTRPTMSEE